MNTALLVGAGRMGCAIAREILETTTAQLWIADTSRDSLNCLNREVARISDGWPARIDSLSSDEIPDAALSADGIVLATPWVDTKPYLQQLFLRNSSSEYPRIIVSITRPDYNDVEWLKSSTHRFPRPIFLPLGLEPGLVELVAARARQIDPSLDSIVTYCGGIPQVPKPPLGHEVLFGSGIAADSRDAWYVRHGVPSVTFRFAGVEPIAIPRIGLLESYHDGMMPATAYDPQFRGMRRFEQRTIRWPGFVERIMTLKELGFLSDDELEINGCSIRKSDFTNRVLAPFITKTCDNDLTVLYVAAGRGDGAQGALSIICRGEPGRESLATMTSVVAVTALRRHLRGARPGWHAPTSPELLPDIPLIFERLRCISQTDFKSSGILREIVESG
jgi:saccharopine dehydrogenase-like NADP-dependent oxidoreductase